MPSHATREVTLRQPTPAELGYLAGILDGEGHFTGSDRSKTFGLVVRMTDQAAIDWLGQHFGGSVSRGGLTRGRKPIYSWNLQRAADLCYVLPLLLPYLTVKGSQAWALWRLADHRLNKPKWALATQNAPAAEREARRPIRERWVFEESVMRRAIRAARFQFVYGG